MAKSRNRPGRERRKKPSSSAAGASQPPETKVYRHSLYGELPMNRTSFLDAEGRERWYFTWDLDYEPPLPKGAVRGRPHDQNFCVAHNAPKYFYVDERHSCVQCGDSFVFSAQEQKFWYETLKFHHNSVAVRCPPCRKRRRTLRALREQIARARAGLEENPKDPALHLAHAESLVRYHQRTGDGSLDTAIAAARQARKLWDGGHEGYFWEGLSHALADRQGRARECLEAFLARAGRSRRLSPFVREAKDRLAEEPREKAAPA